jgi:threonine synthase
MSMRSVEPSYSPSMDIAVSSNFERLLFEMLGRDGAATASTMARFREGGHMPVPDAAWRQAQALFRGFTLDDAGTLAEIRHLAASAGYLADPHTAIGTAAARAHMPEDRAIPVVVAATAHPAKFPDAVEQATGRRPPLPDRMADLYEREERYSVIGPDLAQVEGFVRSHARRND